MKAADLTSAISAVPARAPTALSWVLHCIAAMIVYVASYSLLTAYVGGDQAYYTMMYDLARYSPLDAMPVIQRGTTGSSEPLFGLIIWVLSRIGDKVVIISLCNVVLYYQISLFYKRNSAPIIVYALTLTNFYLLVLFTSAERLKFAMVFLLLFAIMQSKSRYLALVFAVFVHFQIFIFCVSLIMPYAFPSSQNVISTKSRIYAIFATILLSLFVSFSYGTVILDKAASYTQSNALSALPSVVILGCCMAFTRDRRMSFLTLSPLVIFAFILGGERVNMITFIMFIYITVREKNCNNILFLAGMIYFSFRSWGFVENVYNLGSGFVSLQSASL